MFYIKLETDQGELNLVVTQREAIYRGDNLNQKIRYLIPLTVGDIDMLTAFVYLNYIRADGTADIVRLERLEEKYNESYYEYVFPVTCKLTRFPGEVCTWMQIFSGSPSNPIISKTGECVLQIEDSKNMDDYLCDHQISAIYAMEKTKADSLIYDSDERTIQLSADGNPIGEALDLDILTDQSGFEVYPNLSGGGATVNVDGNT